MSAEVHISSFCFKISSICAFIQITFVKQHIMGCRLKERKPFSDASSVLILFLAEVRSRGLQREGSPILVMLLSAPIRFSPLLVHPLPSSTASLLVLRAFYKQTCENTLGGYSLLLPWLWAQLSQQVSGSSFPGLTSVPGLVSFWNSFLKPSAPHPF